MTAILRVDHPGVSATIQDGGRLGLTHLGVARSGAFDPVSAARANRRLGNRPDAPVVEVLVGSTRLTALTTVSVCASGARGNCILVDSARPHDASPRHAPASTAPGQSARYQLPFDEAVEMRAGQQLRLAPARRGVRYYLATAGGFDAVAVLGSCSTDTMSGLGPAPLSQGDILRRRAESSSLTSPHRNDSGAPETPWEAVAEPLPLRIVPGPDAHAVWPRVGHMRLLSTSPWTVSSAVSRIGIRLSSKAPPAHTIGGLPSQPLLPGAIQVSSAGEVMIIGPDGPTTGGYPFVAMIHPDDWYVVGQLRPKQPVRFVADTA